MAWYAHIPHISANSLPAIHSVSSDKPWLWLAAGWSDFIKAPAISLAYGLVVSLAMLAVFQLLQTRGLLLHALGLMAGFALIGPLLAVGLYEISRRLEQRLPVRLLDSWGGWRTNARSLLGMGLLIVLIVLAWLVLAASIMASLYGDEELGFFNGTLLDWQSLLLLVHWPMVLSFGLVGLLAVVVSYVSMVVAVPLLTDREEMNMLTAIVLSLRTVRENPAAMILWAVLIAAFTGLAVAPVFLGLIVAFPLLAYSSWHAYRDLIEH